MIAARGLAGKHFVNTQASHNLIINGIYSEANVLVSCCFCSESGLVCDLESICMFWQPPQKQQLFITFASFFVSKYICLVFNVTVWFRTCCNLNSNFSFRYWYSQIAMLQSICIGVNQRMCICICLTRFECIFIHYCCSFFHPVTQCDEKHKQV